MKNSELCRNGKDRSLMTNKQVPSEPQFSTTMAGRSIGRLRTASSAHSSRRVVERRALRLLICMAWAWIGGFITVIVFHVYRKRHLKNDSPMYAPTQDTTKKTTNQHLRSQPLRKQAGSYDTPLLIFTYKRAKYLSETLEGILNYIPTPCEIGCPIFVSQDGSNDRVSKVIQDYEAKFQSKGIPLVRLQHQKAHTKEAYEALAQHYGWALQKVFAGGMVDSRYPIAQRVIILEEDLNISPDFFRYFQATMHLLDEDPTLFSISAFNDNGHLVHDHKRLLRSDFFPGLGWMMTRKLWVEELQAKWPNGYWDDWLREPDQRKGRQVIRPEFSRTYHFGFNGGASSNQFGSILSSLQLNDEMIDWTSEDLSYLESSTFNTQYGELLQSSRQVSTLNEALRALENENVLLEYKNYHHFERIADMLHIMSDEKATIPRTAYKGVVETRPLARKGVYHQLFLTPPKSQLREDFPAFRHK